MRLIVQALMLFAIAAVVGLGLTALAVRHPPAFDTVQVGPWTSRAAGSRFGADPYALAAVAASGRLPLARGDGIAFEAATDDQGRTLDGACFYHIAGAVPSARVWTLTAQTATGGVFANPADRFAFASSEVTHSAAGAIHIVTGPNARPGDWLPTGKGEFVVELRLYDTTVGDSAAGLEGALPAISRVSCP
jgi:hypothetical protein